MKTCKHKMTKEQKIQRQERVLAAWLLDTTCEKCIDEHVALVQDRFDQLLIDVDEQLWQQDHK